MSFRNTFITDYIYSAGDAVEAAQKLNEAFKVGNDRLTSSLTKDGYGYFAGINRTSSGTVEQLLSYIGEFIIEIERITRVPFRLTYMLESGPTITYDIQPRELLK